MFSFAVRPLFSSDFQDRGDADRIGNLTAVYHFQGIGKRQLSNFQFLGFLELGLTFA